MPTAFDAIATDTPVFYVAWRHPDLSEGETINGRLVVVDVGAAAPAGAEVVSASFPITAAGGAAGSFNFNKPTAGWPPGSYRVEVLRGGQVFGTVDVSIQ